MKFEEKILNSHFLKKRTEFIIIESSERSQHQVRHKHITRKQISFDLRDLEIMLVLGELLDPCGIKELLESKLAQSKIEFFRHWGKKRLIKRGQAFISTLYIKAPEKFSQLELKAKRRGQMQFTKGTLIISELINQKTISLEESQDEHLVELKRFKNNLKEQEMKFHLQKNVIEELTHDRSNEKEHKLIKSSC